MHPEVRPIETLVPRRALAFGRKARALAELIRAGFPVPAGFAIAASVAERAMSEGLALDEQLGALLEAPARSISDERLSAIAAKIRALPIPAPAEEAIRRAYATLAREGSPLVAVRSSALLEDQATRSSAGLYATLLGVEGEEPLLDAIRAVWASAASRRVVAYLRAVGSGSATGAEDGSRAGIGVVVQALIPADVAGVLFTVNPLSGDPGELVVNAAYGLGDGVVDGSVSPDTFRIDKASGYLRDQVLGEKAEATFVRGGALERETIPEERRRQRSLEEPRLRELATLARRVERTFGDARDVEWAIVGERLFVLQARPVTARSAQPKRPGRARDRSRIVWSNVNVGEALPGVATPLTWSILSSFSDVGFRRAFGALGCSVPADAELVGNFRGRIYLNLTDFFAIAAQVPGIAPETILALGGGDVPAELALAHERSVAASAAWLARLPLTAARFARENFRLAQRVERFEERFELDRERLDAIDLRLLSSTAVHRVLLEVERMLDRSGQVLLNVYGNLLAVSIALRALVRSVSSERDDALFRDLSSGLRELDSAEPGLELGRIAESARRDPEVCRYLLATAPEDARVEALPPGPTRRLLEDFVRRYGDRGTREAELAEPRWREDMSLPFATLRLHVERDEGSASSSERRRREVAARAERALSTRVPLPVRPLTRRLVETLHDLLRMRERLRARVVTVLGFFRAVALDASRRMRAMEPGVGEDGAFYLSLDELHVLLSGDVSGVGDLVRTRRLQLARDAALPDPPASFTGSPPPAPSEAQSTDELVGLGASRGRVTGTVRVLHTPSEAGNLRPGEVLVTKRTDVGWSPLFLVAGAIVTELGGPLSHAAIVAREYGVPAVVNVPGASSVLRTGDEVVVDGTHGTVQVVRRG